MSTTEEHIPYLQQIPAFALRQMINESFPGTEGEAQLAAKMRTTLNRRPREVRTSVARLTRLELTQM